MILASLFPNGKTTASVAKPYQKRAFQKREPMAFAKRLKGMSTMHRLEACSLQLKAHKCALNT